MVLYFLTNSYQTYQTHFFLMGSGDDYQPTKIPIEAVGRTRANVRMYPNTGNGQ